MGDIHVYSKVTRFIEMVILERLNKYKSVKIMIFRTTRVKLWRPSNKRPALIIKSYVYLSQAREIKPHRALKTDNSFIFFYRFTVVNYSTVTDLAKLRGWSTSVPLKTAT